MNNPEAQLLPWQTPSLLQPTKINPEDLNDSQREVLEELARQAKEEGYAAGREEALAKHDAELQEKSAELDRMITTIGKPFETLNEQVIQELARLAGMIAEQLVVRELDICPDAILAIVREIVALLPEEDQNIRVTLNDADAAALRELSPLPGREGGWEILQNPDFARGDCLISMGASRVDANLRSRTEAIVRRVLDGQQLGAND